MNKDDSQHKEIQRTISFDFISNLLLRGVDDVPFFTLLAIQATRKNEDSVKYIYVGICLG